MVTYEKSVTGVDVVRDKVGKTEEYESYKDFGRAVQLMEEIKKLEKEIEEFPIKDAKLSATQEEIVRKANVGGILKTVKEEYDRKMNEYMQMNFWGKAKTMFTGKKSKKNASSLQIIETYGADAIDIEMQGELRRAEREFNELVEWIKNTIKIIQKN